jgi:hypothetical protein
MAGSSAETFARRQRAKAEKRVTAAALEALPLDKWRVLHDVPWPGRPRATLDHVVIGPAGVFVIDSRNWPGTVEVRDGVPRQGRSSRRAVVTGAVESGRAVAGVLRTASCPVQPVICLVRDDGIADTSNGVVICSTANVVDVLLARRTLLADVQVQRVARDLSGERLPTLPVPGPRRHRRAKRRSRLVVGTVVAMAAVNVAIGGQHVASGVADRVSTFLGD